MRNPVHGRRRHGVGIQQLAGHQRQSENDAEDGGAAHLSHHRPANPHGDAHVENRLTDEPEKLIHSGPELAQKIEEGLYPSETVFPSESELTAAYACSRATLRRALARLIEHGYIQAGQGRRMRVIYQPTAQNEFMIGGIESFREAAARNHFQAVTRVVHFAEDVVDQKTAEKTGLPLGSAIYDVRRIRYLEGKALILDINLFLREAVPNLTPEIAAHSIYDYIENVLGMTIVTSRRRMTVERAGALDMRWLEMGVYNCLAVVSGRTYNAEGIQFEYTQSRHHPEYFCFEDTAVRRNVR